LQGYSILPSALSHAAPAELTFTYPHNSSEGIPVQFTAGVTDIPFAVQYTVEVSESPDFQGSLIFTANENEIPIEGLAYETTYYARAKTNAWPTYGETITFTTGELPGPVRLWGVTTRSESPCLFGSGGTIFVFHPTERRLSNTSNMIV
jgi:hypothetical protein